MAKQDFKTGALVRIIKGPATGTEGYVQARDRWMIQIAEAMPVFGDRPQGLWVLKEYAEAIS